MTVVAEFTLRGADALLFPEHSWEVAILTPLDPHAVDPARLYPDREFPRWTPAERITPPALRRERQLVVQATAEGDHRGVVVTLTVMPNPHAGPGLGGCPLLLAQRGMNGVGFRLVPLPVVAETMLVDALSRLHTRPLAEASAARVAEMDKRLGHLFDDPGLLAEQAISRARRAL